MFVRFGVPICMFFRDETLFLCVETVISVCTYMYVSDESLIDCIHIRYGVCFLL